MGSCPIDWVINVPVNSPDVIAALRQLKSSFLKIIQIFIPLHSCQNTLSFSKKLDKKLWKTFATFRCYHFGIWESFYLTFIVQHQQGRDSPIKNSAILVFYFNFPMKSSTSRKNYDSRAWWFSAQNFWDILSGWDLSAETRVPKFKKMKLPCTEGWHR